MNTLSIYQPKKQTLNEVAFVRDTLTQHKIRDINNSYELGKQMAIIITEFYNRCGVKGEMTEFNARDIKQMINMRFSTLSLNEIAYAFKMERYGELGERTEHYQSFDAMYVATILDKWVNRKREIKARHNISKKASAPMISEEEKQRLINNAVGKVLRHFLEHKTILEGYVFVYEELVDSKLLNLSVEEKKEIYKAAQDLLEMEYSEKKATSREERGQIKSVLDNLATPNEPIVVQKAKELSMQRFFRELLKDEKRFNDFKEKYYIET